MQNLRAATQRLAVSAIGVRGAIASRMRSERGEGVISMAIAVLIIAFLGVALWFVFQALVDDTGTKVGEQVDNIGSSPG